MVLPVLILIILVIVYFGRYEDYANQATQLSEIGVRWAAVWWHSGCMGAMLTGWDSLRRR